MSEQKVFLRRNQFLIFVLNFLPFVLAGGVIAVWLFRTVLSDVSKIVCLIFFITALIVAFRKLKGNDKVLTFYDNTLYVCENKKLNPKVLKKISENDIRRIDCTDRPKRISVELVDGSIYELLNYKNVPQLGEKSFFLTKAELCRCFPSKTVDIFDENCKTYIETNVLPEFIKNKEWFGNSTAVIFTFIEFILAVIPLGMSILAFFWVLLLIIKYIMMGVLEILNLFS